MLLFSTEKTEFPFFVFPYFRVLPFSVASFVAYFFVRGWGPQVSLDRKLRMESQQKSSLNECGLPLFDTTPAAQPN